MGLKTAQIITICLIIVAIASTTSGQTWSGGHPTTTTSPPPPTLSSSPGYSGLAVAAETTTQLPHTTQQQQPTMTTVALRLDDVVSSDGVNQQIYQGNDELDSNKIIIDNDDDLLNDYNELGNMDETSTSDSEEFSVLLDEMVSEGSGMMNDVDDDLVDQLLGISREEDHELRQVVEPQKQEEEQECTMSFKLPPKIQCQRDSSNDEHIRQIYKDVMEAKGGIEHMKSVVESARDDIISQQLQFPSVQQVKESLSTVERLKAESHNSNERVNQLYMQLMHEIINKRDHQLDYEKLRSKILEQNVQYHQLQESLTAVEVNMRELEKTASSQAVQIKLMEIDHTTMKERMDKLETMCSERLAMIDKKYEQADVSYDPERLIENERRETNEEKNSRRSQVKAQGNFMDCTHVQQHGHTESGIYRIRTSGERKSVKVWCDFDLDPGGWIVIQRRTEGRTDFNRGMAMYKKGFGRIKSDYWLGLDTLHRITNNSNIGYKLHIELEDWDGNRRFAEYQSFKVAGEEKDYQLRIAHYSGNAGDSMTRNNHMRFTTKDADNDQYHNHNCAFLQQGGWWHNSCGDSNLNGLYYSSGAYESSNTDGMYWSSWHGSRYSLRSIVMMIRPND